jgi:cellulose 1,4-beta-cellobiosidase
VLLEPDSLANLATNSSITKCAESDSAYRRSIAYAVSKLALPNVAVYLDAAHAGWLGWTANRTKIAAIYKDVLGAAGGAGKIRGFLRTYRTTTCCKATTGGGSNPRRRARTS